jgi:hypothetical protein
LNEETKREFKRLGIVLIGETPWYRPPNFNGAAIKWLYFFSRTVGDVLYIRIYLHKQDLDRQNTITDFKELIRVHRLDAIDSILYLAKKSTGENADESYPHRRHAPDQ